MRFCTNCGLLAADDQLTRCPKCGAALPCVLPEPEPAPPPAAAPRYEVSAPEDGLSLIENLLMLLVFLIPVAGFVMMLVWSFVPSVRPARRRLAQAYLIRFLAVAVVLALLVLSIGLSAAALIQSSYWGGYAW